MREATVAVDDAAFDAMGIGDLVAVGREAGLLEVEELACHGTGAVVRLTVESRCDEQRLAALDAVDEWEHVAETDGGHVYVIAVTAPDLPEDAAEEAEDLVGTCDPVLTAEGASMSLVGPQSSISGTIRAYESAGASPDLRKLGAYEGRDDPTDALTDRQEEVLRTAFDVGYYEVPREATTADVAAELGVDPSTVAEHLQRAERNVLDRIL